MGHEFESDGPVLKDGSDKKHQTFLPGAFSENRPLAEMGLPVLVGKPLPVPSIKFEHSKRKTL
jgi:hypothetical protein